MEIIRLDEGDERWQKFLDRTPHLIFHTPQYKKFMRESFKSKVIYYAAVDTNEIKAILPVMFVKHPLLGKKLISTAYLEYGGPCGDKKYIADIINHAYKEFSKKCDYFEVRQGLEGYDKELTTLMKKDVSYKRFVLKLGSVEEVWKCVQKAKRKAIKKSESEGVVVKEIKEGECSALYNLYAKNMRDFGSPPFHKRFFTNFFRHIVKNNLGKCYGAYYKGKLVSILLGFMHKDRIHITIAVSDQKYLKYRPNDAVHWAFIKFGCENKFKVFDFGRVREESGQFEYKRKWGCELFELPHYYLLWKVDEVPMVDPNNPKYRFVLRVWRRLPLFIIRMVGPWLREGLGI